MRHYLTLAQTQLSEALTEPRQLSFALAPGPVMCQPQLNCVQQVLIPKGLNQKFDCARFHRLDCHGNISMSRDKYDRQVDIDRSQRSLKIESATPGKSYIQHQASRSARQLRFNKL